VPSACLFAAIGSPVGTVSCRLRPPSAGLTATDSCKGEGEGRGEGHLNHDGTGD
jgi:hypothetical protein